jgi:hypothetical protein
LSGIFILWRELKRASCVTLSNAFSQSSASKRVEVFVDSPLAIAILHLKNLIFSGFMLTVQLNKNYSSTMLSLNQNFYMA